MRKHGTITAYAGVGRLPPIPNRRAQGRTAVLSALHRLFRKASFHHREPRVPQEQPGHRESQGCRESQALIFRGGHARNRVVFINSGRGRGKKRALPESCGVADLALCLRPFAAAKCEWREAPGESPPRGLTLMKTSRFLAGLPCFSATKVRGGRLRGRARISEPTAPRRRKRAVDQAIESSHHTQSERHIGSHRPASLSTHHITAV